jgi:RNA polymerase sigma factor (TIGR02999 family)
VESPDAGTITRLLADARRGNPDAADELAKAVYGDLRRIAQRHMRGERADHTLQPTALVHEAFLRLTRSESVDWTDRNHFFSVAASVMRRILVDHARAHAALKRGASPHKVELSDTLVYSEENAEDLIALDRALEKLGSFAPRQCRLIELHFFGGLTFDESAAVLGVSAKTLKRDWIAARTWLHGEMFGWRNDSAGME